jgi:membrane protease YdiL (CAAX protease family)
MLPEKNENNFSEISSSHLSEKNYEQPLIVNTFGLSTTVFAVIILLVVFISYQLLGALFSTLLFGVEFSEKPLQLRLGTMFAQLLLLLVPTLYIAHFETHDMKSFLRLKPPKISQIILAVIGVFSLGQALQVIILLQEKIPIPSSVQTVLDEIEKIMEQAFGVLVNAQSIPELLFVIFVVAVVPALCEELLFRGLVQRNFEHSFSTTRGFIITGILFGAYHLNPFLIIPLSALGIYFGFLVARSGSIWVAISAHFVNNALAAIATYLHIGDDFVVTGNPQQLSGIELFSTFALGCCVFFITTFYFLKTVEISEPVKEHIPSLSTTEYYE